jgi:hypothetical protein
MFETMQLAGSLSTDGSAAYFAIAHMGVWGLSFVVGLPFVWMASHPMRRKRLMDLFFYHRDRDRRKTELRMLWLAVGLGLFLAVLIAAAIYVLNVTNRL